MKQINEFTLFILHNDSTAVSHKDIPFYKIIIWCLFIFSNILEIYVNNGRMNQLIQWAICRKIVSTFVVQVERCNGWSTVCTKTISTSSVCCVQWRPSRRTFHSLLQTERPLNAYIMLNEYKGTPPLSTKRCRWIVRGGVRACLYGTVEWQLLCTM